MFSFNEEYLTRLNHYIMLKCAFKLQEGTWNSYCYMLINPLETNFF
jgi:hypothetical protein